MVQKRHHTRLFPDNPRHEVDCLRLTLLDHMIFKLFEIQVERTPEAVAVLSEQKQIA